MKKQKVKKGEFGYPIYEKKKVILLTAVYFLISIAVFLLGYFSTGKKENLLTVVAVLGLLPSSKSLVSAIMYIRIPKFSPGIYEEIAAKTGELSVLYSMYLTSYKLNFPITCFAIRGNNLIGYTEFKSCNTTACEEHIKDMLKQNSLKNVTVKIFDEQKRFTERLTQLQELEGSKKETDVLELLCDISL
ncbi:MAG: hypothetical protein J6C19_06395 [Lachnospiraceae bacterium]|nr:hypothetical protein [Lachnospiraceae bacterium]